MVAEKSRLLGTMLVGCCMAVVCLGCGPAMRHGCLIRGQRSLECKQAACTAPCSPNPCRTGGGPLGGRARGHASRPIEAEVGYYNHPRFHPVPTEPVFSPRDDAAYAVHGGPFSRGYIPGAHSDDEPPRIELSPPGAVPEEIRAPQPELKEEPERVTAAPRRLTTAARPFGWIFRPPAPSGRADALPHRL